MNGLLVDYLEQLIQSARSLDCLRGFLAWPYRDPDPVFLGMGPSSYVTMSSVLIFLQARSSIKLDSPAVTALIQRLLHFNRNQNSLTFSEFRDRNYVPLDKALVQPPQLHPEARERSFVLLVECAINMANRLQKWRHNACQTIFRDLGAYELGNYNQSSHMQHKNNLQGNQSINNTRSVGKCTNESCMKLNLKDVLIIYESSRHSSRIESQAVKLVNRLYIYEYLFGPQRQYIDLDILFPGVNALIEQQRTQIQLLREQEQYERYKRIQRETSQVREQRKQQRVIKISQGHKEIPSNRPIRIESSFQDNCHDNNKLANIIQQKEMQTKKQVTVELNSYVVQAANEQLMTVQGPIEQRNRFDSETIQQENAFVSSEIKAIEQPILEQQVIKEPLKQIVLEDKPVVQQANQLAIPTSRSMHEQIYIESCYQSKEKQEQSKQQQGYQTRIDTNMVYTSQQDDQQLFTLIEVSKVLPIPLKSVKDQARERIRQQLNQMEAKVIKRLR